MLPLFSRMDRKGKVVNAAFSVCGAYLVGGQFAFVSSLTNGRQLSAYFFCKLIAGVLGIAAVVVIPAFTAEKQLLLPPHSGFGFTKTACFRVKILRS